jgi:hypothetical protein
VTWVAVVVAALGGGIIATALGGWVRLVRAFEAARVLAIGDLTTLLVTSQTVATTEPIGLAPGIQWATYAWEHHREALTLGLQSRDSDLFEDLAIVFFSVTVMGGTGMQIFDETRRAEIEGVRDRLRALHLRWYEACLVYGPRFAIRAARERRPLTPPAAPPRPTTT